jgi:thiol-disulfide isomerase/thioredoxin
MQEQYGFTEVLAQRREIASVDEFDKVLKDTAARFEPLLVQFTAGWCKACHRIKDELEERFNEDHRIVNWVGVDVDNLDELRERYEVKEMPCVLIFFRSDQPAWRASGMELSKNSMNVVAALKTIDQKRPVFTKDEDF